MKFRNSKNEPVVYSGEEVTWRIAAYALVFNDEGKILLIKAAHHNLWQVPGGRVEMEETVAEAIHREGLEETGYDIVLSSSNPIYFSEDYFFHEGKKAFHKTLQLYFRGKLNSNNRDNSNMDEYDSMGKVEWVDPADITAENTQVTLWPVIKQLQATY